MAKKIVLLGSTGSIGTQTLDIVNRLPGRFEILGLAANNNVEQLAHQAITHRASYVCIGSEEAAARLRLLVPDTVRVLTGVAGMCEMATLPDADMVVVAVAGAIGIAPTHAAISAGKEIALASKEVLVAAGEVTMRLARENKVSIRPIDSEHSAIFQCLQGAPAGSIEKILLTASGGPFRNATAERLETVTPEEALKHPTWNMGDLVTINSATLMNKSLEVMEAYWLFGVHVQDIEVVVHPQSIVHSMVQFRDGSTIAQLGRPDMRLPIQYALVYPERVNTDLPRMRLADYANLTFEAPDETRFPALGLARAALTAGGTLPAVMNAANESAVDLFLKHKIGFLDIARTVEKTMLRHQPVDPTLDNVLAADAWARAEVVRLVC